MTRDDVIARVEAAVRERGGDVTTLESRFRCARPERHENGDARATASWNSKKKAYFCQVCCEGGGYKKLARLLGLEVNGRQQRRGTRRPSSARVVATYDYRDERGELLYQVCRYEWVDADGKRQKDFSQRRPDGHGGWIWKLKGVQRVLYRLPELLA